MKRFALLAILALFAFAGKANAGDGKWGGYAFGDTFWIASHHARNFQGTTGTQIRRVYLNYDYDFGEGWTSRFRFEIGHANDQNGAAATPAITAKDIWLQKTWGTHSGIFGIQPTAAFGTEEDFWGYRAVEKVFLDLQGMRSSRDTGLAVKGHIDQDKMFGYHVLAGNNSGQSNQLNKNWQFEGAFTVAPMEGFIVEVGADYQNNTKCGAATDWRGTAFLGDDLIAPGAAAATTPAECLNNTSKYMGRAFMGYKGGWGRVGAGFFHLVEEQFLTGRRWGASGAGTGVAYANDGLTAMEPDMHMNAVSVFGVAKILDNLNTYARYDYADYPRAQMPLYFNSAISNARPHFFLWGLDYSPVKSVHILPNVEVMAYGKSVAANANGGVTFPGPTAKAQTAATIVIPRLTFFWKFK